MCSTKKAHANKFIWGLACALKGTAVNQRPSTLAQAVEIACLSEEVLNEQFRPLKKDEGKTKGSGNNNNNVTNLPQVPQKKNELNKIGNNQKRKNDDNEEEKKEKLICPTCKHRHVGESWRNNMKCFTCWDKDT